MTIPAVKPVATPGDIMEQVLLKGDIGKLTPAERVSYYDAVCRSMGLNPYTKPFEFIVLNGRMQLYALRNCTDQLRKINAVSLEIISKEVIDDIMTVHVRAKLPDGRVDEDLGAVAYPATLKGEARANAELKCITKAKRRATLSICGLSFLDETEVEDIPANGKRANPITPGGPEEYYAPVEPGDELPPSDPSIQPTLRGKQKILYGELQNEMLSKQTVEQLDAWALDTKTRRGQLDRTNFDWLKSAFGAHRKHLREKTAQEKKEYDAYVAARSEDYPRPTPKHDPETGEVRDMVPDLMPDQRT